MKKTIYILSITDFNEGTNDVSVFTDEKKAHNEMEMAVSEFIESYDLDEDELYEEDNSVEIQDDDFWVRFEIQAKTIEF